MGQSGMTEIVLVLLVLLILLLPLIAVTSILKNRLKGRDRLIWIMVVLILPVIGSILYFTTGSDSKLREW